MLSKLLQKDKVTLADVTLFKKQCVVFVVNIIQKMFDKSPLSNHFVKYSSCFRPDKVLDNHDGHLMMKKLLRSLVNLQILTETHSDLALRQYISFTKEDAKLNASLLNEVSRSNDHLDDFYFKKMKISKFKELALVCKIVFNLVERAEKEENLMLVTKATAMKRKKRSNFNSIQFNSIYSFSYLYK